MIILTKPFFSRMTAVKYKSNSICCLVMIQIGQWEFELLDGNSCFVPRPHGGCSEALEAAHLEKEKKGEGKFDTSFGRETEMKEGDTIEKVMAGKKWLIKN